MKFETLSVIGLGYIGLPTAATFASRGLKVVGVDVNQRAVDIINPCPHLCHCLTACRGQDFGL